MNEENPHVLDQIKSIEETCLLTWEFGFFFKILKTV